MINNRTAHYPWRLIFITGILAFLLLFVLWQKLIVLAAPGDPLPLARGIQIPDGATASRLPPGQYQWVKFQYVAGSQQPIKSWVQQAKSNGYKVLVSIAKNDELKLVINDGDICGNGTTENGYDKFYKYTQTLAADLGSSVDAYEIWNEPNLDSEWKNMGAVNASSFKELLLCGARGVKAANGGVSVISAGLSPNPANFGEYLSIVSQTVAETPEIDYLGAHVYPVEATLPADGGTLSQLGNYINKGKPVWVTEIGWNMCLANIDATKTRSNLNDAFNFVQSKYPDIHGMAVWNFGFVKLQSSDDFKCYDIESGSNTGGQNTPINPLERADDLNAINEPEIEVTSDAEGNLNIVYKGKKQSDPATCNGSGGSGNTISDPSGNNDQQIAGTLTEITLPNEVSTDFKSKIDKSKTSNTGVNQDFFQAASCTISALFGRACQLNTTSGRDIDEYSATTQALALTHIPSGMKIYPAENDCNVFDLKPTDNTDGNRKLNEISGFSKKYNQPELDDKEKLIEECKEEANLQSGNNGQYTQDGRVCQRDIEQYIEDQSFFPDDVRPQADKQNKFLKGF